MTSIDYFWVKKKIRKLGYEFYREWRWSHEIWYNEKLNKTIILPNHWKKDIKKWTLSSIIKACWITVLDFWSL